jgi:hypothetical protein
MANDKNICVKRTNYLTKNNSNFTVDAAVSVTFFNKGTYAWYIDEFLLMPNASYTDALQGNNRIKHRYNIRIAFDSGIIGDAELQNGAWLIYNIWEDANP